MKKYLIGCLLAVLLLTGCGKNEITKSYDKMQIGKEIESYQLDLRIYGTHNNKSVSEIVRVDNYKGTQFRIDYISMSNRKETPRERAERDEKDLRKDNALYIIDNVKYRQNDSGRFVKTTEESLYTDPTLYLNGLKHLKSNEYNREETSADKKYKVYTISVKASTMKDILKNSVLQDVKLTKDVTGEVWIDADEYVYKIIYNVHTGMEDSSKNLVVNASYFRINNVSEIKKMIMTEES